jgi:hypothetical protein
VFHKESSRREIYTRVSKSEGWLRTPKSTRHNWSWFVIKVHLEDEILRPISFGAHRSFFFIFYSLIHMNTHIHMCGQCMHPPPTPSLSPHPPRFQEEPVLPFSPILFKRRHKQ